MLFTQRTTRRTTGLLSQRLSRWQWPPEIAGFVWFQGIADAESGAFAAAYEKNVAGLIHDVRREFAKPVLPFVVAAFGQSV